VAESQPNADDSSNQQFVPIPYPVIMQPPAQKNDQSNGIDNQNISPEQDTVGVYEYEGLDRCGRAYHALLDMLACPLTPVTAPRSRTPAGVLIGTHMRTVKDNAPASSLQVTGAMVVNLVVVGLFAIVASKGLELLPATEGCSCLKDPAKLYAACAAFGVLMQTLVPIVLGHTLGEIATGTVVLKDSIVMDLEVTYPNADDSEDEDEDSEDDSDDEEHGEGPIVVLTPEDDHDEDEDHSGEEDTEEIDE